MTRLWGGRFDDDPAAELLAFTESLSFDRELVREDCAVLSAHVSALGARGIMSDLDTKAAREALLDIADDIADGRFEPRATDEDVHTLVERALLERLPDIAPKVRTGLSRNDRVAAALRLWLMRSGTGIRTLLADLIDTLALRASEHTHTLMPGYTHLQRAQPVTLAQHLLAHAFALVRDAERIVAALDRTDASPLGAGALAGSTLALEHDPADAGFVKPMENTIDAVAARDFVAEFLSAAAILGVDLSRLGEELVLWTSSEFGFARLADAYATGSSLMPQKKNPDVAELVRGKTGRLIGNLTSMLVTLKGLPLAYNRDLQEDKEPLFDSVRTLATMLPAITGALRTMAFDADRMRAAIEPAALATDLAEALVGAGVPFREAHERVGAAVAESVRQNRPLRAADVGLEDEGILDPARSIDARAMAEHTEVQLGSIAQAVRSIRAR